MMMIMMLDITRLHMRTVELLDIELDKLHCCVIYFLDQKILHIYEHTHEISSLRRD
jgi:hypothetical protein